eukprot:CFRG0618T1
MVRHSPRKPHGPSRTPAAQLQKGNQRTPGTPRKRRFRPGSKALIEIRRFQKSTDLLLRKRPFARLVRELCQDYVPSRQYRWTSDALLAIQDSLGGFVDQFMVLGESIYVIRFN